MKVDVTAAKNISEVLGMAKLDYNVVTRPVYDNEGRRIDGYQAVTRESDSHIFSIMGDRYVPMQNIEAFSSLDELGLRYVSAGSFGGKTFVQAQLPGEIKVAGMDTINKLLTFVNSYDGSVSISLFLTLVRIVCQNTLMMALQRGEYLIRAKHTQTAKLKFKNAKELFEVVNLQVEGVTKVYDTLIKTPMKLATVDEFLKELFIGEKVVEANIPTKTLNKMDRIKFLFENGKGADMHRGTAWGLYNAISEYTDHEANTRGSESKEESRLVSSMFGSGAKLKEESFSKLLELVNV